MKQITPLHQMLSHAHKNRYAVGSFSPRSTLLIEPIIKAAMETDSPVLIQVSQKELDRHALDLLSFSKAFHTAIETLNPSIPVGLHLDHTKDLAIIQEAINCGFTSVMIDASEFPYEENSAITKKVVAMAHKSGVDVEAELGRIGTTDYIETIEVNTQFTNPVEAIQFIETCQIDALAVSVGTSHGVYHTKGPTISLPIIEAINRESPTPLVLHGGSGVPKELLHEAITLQQGGISKVNIATDLELCMLDALHFSEHLSQAQLDRLSDTQKKEAQDAVQHLVVKKMKEFVLSSGWGIKALKDFGILQ